MAFLLVVERSVFPSFDHAWSAKILRSKIFTGPSFFLTKERISQSQRYLTLAAPFPDTPVAGICVAGHWRHLLLQLHLL